MATEELRQADEQEEITMRLEFRVKTKDGEESHTLDAFSPWQTALALSYTEVSSLE
jgi:hypothetical protein